MVTLNTCVGLAGISGKTFSSSYLEKLHLSIPYHFSENNLFSDFKGAQSLVFKDLQTLRGDGGPKDVLAFWLISFSLDKFCLGTASVADDAKGTNGLAAPSPAVYVLRLS